MELWLAPVDKDGATVADSQRCELEREGEFFVNRRDFYWEALRDGLVPAFTTWVGPEGMVVWIHLDRECRVRKGNEIGFTKGALRIEAKPVEVMAP